MIAAPQFIARRRCNMTSVPGRSSNTVKGLRFWCCGRFGKPRHREKKKRPLPSQALHRLQR
jgi:hypothetical protein